MSSAVSVLPRLLAVGATVLTAFCVSAFAQESGAWTREKKDVRIPTRDGKWLSADLHFPPVEGAYPAVLIQTPYNKDYFGAEVGERVAGRRVRRRVRGLYDRELYVYVIVDWRGFYGSKSAALGKGRHKRGEDGYDSVEWIAKQPWSDGKVGTWGGSALGKQQFDTAAEKPPHLVCCVPMIACMGQMYEFYYGGGVYREAHVRTLKLLGYQIGNKVWNAPRPNQLIWAYAKRLTYRPEALDVPMLFVTGWWDHFPDAIVRMFADVRKMSGPVAREHSKILIGPWTHMDVDLVKQGSLRFLDAADEEKKATRAFFDFWLRGKKDNRWDNTAPYRYFQVGDAEGRSGRWFASEAWPDAGETKILHLHADGLIAAGEPGKADAETPLLRSYIYDPQEPSPTLGGCNLPPLAAGPVDQSPLEKREDVLVYSTPPLGDPLRVLGNMKVAFSFTVNRVDADFSVRICDVHPNDKAYLVADGIQRARFRAGKRPRLLEPGETYEIEVVLPLTAYTFAKGHALKVLLSSSNHTRYERNPHTGSDHWDGKKALDLKVTIFHDEDRPCTISLPVIK